MRSDRQLLLTNPDRNEPLTRSRLMNRPRARGQKSLTVREVHTSFIRLGFRQNRAAV